MTRYGTSSGEVLFGPAHPDNRAYLVSAIHHETWDEVSRWIDVTPAPVPS